MGRQRPTCFGSRHRLGASPGSLTKTSRPGGVAEARQRPKLEGKARLLPGIYQETGRGPVP